MTRLMQIAITPKSLFSESPNNSSFEGQVSYNFSNLIGASPAMKLLQPKKRLNPQSFNDTQRNLKLRDSESPELSEIPSNCNPPSPKKIRDLPNLTECHACGFKIDVCTGKNGLRTLYSEWRIVLVCNKCFSSIKSSQICSYCFSETTSECYRCIRCRHSVHQSCFLNYKNTAPWSYSCLGSEFSVCVDCWIPKPVAISRRRRRVKSGVSREKGRDILEEGNSRVLGDGNLLRSMEDVVKDANLEMEKKVEVAVRARDKAIKKAVVAGRAVDLANNALSIVSNREGSNLDLPLSTHAVKVSDGSELTFELHQHMNSSPRISKSCCLLNTCFLNNPMVRASSLDSSCKTLNLRNAVGFKKHELLNDKSLYEDSLKSLCVPSISIGSLDRDSSTDLNSLYMGRSDMKTSSKDGECIAGFNVEEEIGEELLKEGEGSCSDRLINFGGEDCGMEHDRKQVDSAMHGEEIFNGQLCRYSLKYRRRNYRLKPILTSKPKSLYDKIYVESQDSAVGVPLMVPGN